MKSSECDDICNLFPAMTLKDTCSGIKSNTLEDHTSAWKLKKKEKKQEVMLSVNKKSMNKKKKNKKEDEGFMKECRRVRDVNEWNEKNAVGNWRLYYGVKKSVLGTRFFAEITYPDGRLVCIGTFKSPKLAAMAYDITALKIYGPKASFNFPHRVRMKEPVMVTHPPPSTTESGHGSNN